MHFSFSDHQNPAAPFPGHIAGFPAPPRIIVLATGFSDSPALPLKKRATDKRLLIWTWRLMLLLLLQGCTQTSMAALPPPDERGQPLSEATVLVHDASEMDILQHSPVSFAEARHGSLVRVIATPTTLAALESRGLQVTVTRRDHRLSQAEKTDYHSPESMITALQGLAEEWPDRAKVVDLGTSYDGQPIVGLQIGESPLRVRLLGAHHGDELSSAEIVLAVAEEVLSRNLLDDLELWVVPHVNPDGVSAGSRYNGRGVDLNRNYDYQWSAQEYRSGDEPFSESETRAIRTLSLYRSFGKGLSLHSGSELICYVWNWTETSTPDEQLLRSTGDTYAESCGLDSFYSINGAAWYITHGDTTDWAYGRQGTLDFTLEVSRSKTPPAEDLDYYIEAHLGAILDFATDTPSITGNVVSALDGSPVQAAITPEDSWTSYCGPDGSFTRWLEAGPTRMVVSAPGYTTASFLLELPENETLEMDLVLESSDLELTRPKPALLTWSSDPTTTFLEGRSTEQVTLWRPGFQEHSYQLRDGWLTIIPSELEPGPWGISTEYASTPNAIFIGERTDSTRITAIDWQDERMEVRGYGFGSGTAAWLIGGLSRSLSPVPVLRESADSLELEVFPTGDPDYPVDLLIVSAGAQLVAMDLLGEVGWDTAAPRDTGSSPDTAVPLQEDGSATDAPGAPGKGGCGCTASNPLDRGPLSVTIAAITVWLLRRRRVRDVPSYPSDTVWVRPNTGTSSQSRT